jgi:hypothetical protein
VSGAIFKSTAVTGMATLVSRITGLAREMIYAQAFGASAFMDAWLRRSRSDSCAACSPKLLQRVRARHQRIPHKRSSDEVRDWWTMSLVHWRGVVLRC